MQVIYKQPYGSTLYGTSTEGSDKDFIAFFLPSFTDMLNGKVPMSPKHTSTSDNTRKNTAEDEDVRYVSVQKFGQDFYAGKQYATECAFAVAAVNPLNGKSGYAETDKFMRFCQWLVNEVTSTRNVLDEKAIKAVGQTAKDTAFSLTHAPKEGADLKELRKRIYTNARLAATSDELRTEGWLDFPMKQAERLRAIKEGTNVNDNVSRLIDIDRAFMHPRLIRNANITQQQFDLGMATHLIAMYGLESKFL